MHRKQLYVILELPVRQIYLKYRWKYKLIKSCSKNKNQALKKKIFEKNFLKSPRLLVHLHKHQNRCLKQATTGSFFKSFHYGRHYMREVASRGYSTNFTSASW